MSSFCLRYRAMDVGLEAGELVVGREDGCDLVLDDALVSRRHAQFRVTQAGVEVEDLGSRNGVHVNGARISAPTQLRPGDTVRIGSQVLLLEVAGALRQASRPLTSELMPCPRCGSVVSATAANCVSCQAPLHPDLATTPGSSAAAVVQPSRSSFKTLAALADKALGMDRGDEAERILASTLDGLLQDATGGAVPPDDAVREASAYALKLALAGVRGRLDFLFQLYAALGRMMTPQEVEQLYQAASAARYTGSRSIRAYLDRLRPQAGSFSASDRFLLQRLEGLERRLRGS